MKKKLCLESVISFNLSFDAIFISFLAHNSQNIEQKSVKKEQKTSFWCKAFKLFIKIACIVTINKW